MGLLTIDSPILNTTFLIFLALLVQRQQRKLKTKGILKITTHKGHGKTTLAILFALASLAWAWAFGYTHLNHEIAKAFFWLSAWTSLLQWMTVRRLARRLKGAERFQDVFTIDF